eukprot:gene845-846_t
MPKSGSSTAARKGKKKSTPKRAPPLYKPPKGLKSQKASSSKGPAKKKKKKEEDIDLHEAIRKKDMAQIQKFVDIPWDHVRRRRLAKVVEPHGTPLDVAIDMDDFNLVKMLFDAGSWDLIVEYGQQNSLLIRCLTTAKLELARHVIERGADVHRDNHIPNMIAVACYAVDAEYVKTWDRMSGMKITERYEKYHQLIDLLVEKGAKVGDMEWFYAVNHGYLPVVKSFLKHGKIFPTTLRIEIQAEGFDIQEMNIIEYAERMRRFDVANCLKHSIIGMLTKPYPKREELPPMLKDRDCAICFESFKEGEDVVVLKCGHPYHKECLAPVIENKAACCPYCRSKIISY